MSPYKSDAFSIVPSRSILSIATFVSQLFGMILFLLAATWMLQLHRSDGGVVAIAVLGAFAVFAGGRAHRGSIGALAVCAGIDLAIGAACLIRSSVALDFVYGPTSWIAPAFAKELHLAMLVISVVALINAVVCILAIPQTRRYLTWHRTQMTVAPPLW